MTDDQRHGCRAAALLMDKMDIDAIYRRQKMGKLVDDGFLGAPIEFVAPLPTDLTQVLEVLEQRIAET